MAAMPDVTEIRKQVTFDFAKLQESAERPLNRTARKRIHEIGVRVVYLARRQESYPRLRAAESRRMATAIAEEAIHARQRLRSLIARLDEAFMCGLPNFAGMDELERRDLLAQAMHVVKGIAFAAGRQSAQPRRGGRRPRQLLKELVWALHGVYRDAGGRRSVTYRASRKGFFGAPLLFVYAAVCQIRPFLPEGAVGEILPKSDRALKRAIVAAIRTAPAKDKNPLNKTE